MDLAMTDHLKDFSSAERIAAEGERLYAERHKVRLEGTGVFSPRRLA